MCQAIIAHKLFDYVVLAFIFSNCITVALERPKILQGSLVNPSVMYISVSSAAASDYNFLCVNLCGHYHHESTFYCVKCAVTKVLLLLIVSSLLFFSGRPVCLSASLFFSRKESFSPSPTTSLPLSLWAR